ncbi:MAG: M23 family metallopeptidase [Chloroflexi bacterium]|nr:M23 family metallopeptidase [Chloroflexota bacterium]
MMKEKLENFISGWVIFGFILVLSLSYTGYAQEPDETEASIPVNEQIMVDFEGHDDITQAVKQGIIDVLEAESHLFTDRTYFVVSAYQNYHNTWVKAVVVAPDKQSWASLQGYPTAELLLTNRSGAWEGHTEYNVDYNQLQMQVPADFIDYQALRRLPTVIAHKFPWRNGHTWKLTKGWHGDGFQVQNNIDFAPVGSASDDVLASATGVLQTSCNRSDDSVQVAFHINHADGSKTEYLHIAKSTARLDLVGQSISQGQYLGDIYHAYNFNTPCGYGSGPHLHFGLSDTTVDIDGYAANTVGNSAYGTEFVSSNDSGCCGCGTIRQSDIQLSSLASALAIGPPVPSTNPSNQSAKHFQRIRLSENQNKTLIPRAPGSFNKDQVLCDNDLLDVNAMSETDIQNLLDQRNSFFKDYYDPQTGLLASHIIYTQAQNNQISPRLILAKMQAESSSIWYWKDMSVLIDPSQPELGTKADWVLFYGWPDSSPPNLAYMGFYNQVHNAAQSLRSWFDDPGAIGWAIGQPHAVSDGMVTPVNATTIALYQYTPWISSNNLLWQVWWMMWGDTGCSSDGNNCCGCGNQATESAACPTPSITTPEQILPTSTLSPGAVPTVESTFVSDTMDVTAPILPSDTTIEDSNWQNDPIPPDFVWKPAVDAESGVVGYHVYWGDDPDGTAATLVTEPAYTPPNLSHTTDIAIRYLRVALVDGADNQGAWRTITVWRYDGVRPTATLRVNNGGGTTRSLNVTLHLLAHDTGSHVAFMRFSSEGLNWTEWEPYNPRRGWTLDNLSDRQFVYAQVQDSAGNESPVYRTTISAKLNVPRPSSSSYQLARSVVAMGGGVKTSANYHVEGTSGQVTSVGQMTSASYTINSGFWPSVASAASPKNRYIYLPLVVRGQ